MPFSVDKEERKYGSIALVKIQGREPNNTLIKEDLYAFPKLMQELSQEVDGMLLYSANEKFFSNGLDGAILLELPKEERRATVEAMMKIYPELFKIPKPWVAEIAGYAMAGGAVLSTAADNRYMLEKSGRIGFSEMLVGMPLPAVYLAGVQKLVNPKYLRDIMYGAAYKPEDALDIGLIDGIAPDRDKLRKMCLKQLDTLLRFQRQSFLMTRSLNRGAIIREMEALLPTDLEAGANAAMSSEFEDVLKKIASKNR